MADMNDVFEMRRASRKMLNLYKRMAAINPAVQIDQETVEHVRLHLQKCSDALATKNFPNISSLNGPKNVVYIASLIAETHGLLAERANPLQGNK